MILDLLLASLSTVAVALAVRPTPPRTRPVQTTIFDHITQEN